MSTAPSPYRSMISPRSRRLRTIGLLLLAAIAGLTLYGYFSLMPSLRTARASYERSRDRARQSSRLSTLPPASNVGASVNVGASASGAGASARPLERARKALLVKVIFLYAYWSVCGLLIVAALFVAWLDLREVSQNYLHERRALWNEAAVRMQREKDGRDG